MINLIAYGIYSQLLMLSDESSTHTNYLHSFLYKLFYSCNQKLNDNMFDAHRTDSQPPRRYNCWTGQRRELF